MAQFARAAAASAPPPLTGFISQRVQTNAHRQAPYRLDLASLAASFISELSFMTQDDELFASSIPRALVSTTCRRCNTNRRPKRQALQ
ncbi:hypothetical protein BLAT2472_20510 [Burkholderia latens]